VSTEEKYVIDLIKENKVLKEKLKKLADKLRDFEGSEHAWVCYHIEKELREILAT